MKKFLSKQSHIFRSGSVKNDEVYNTEYKRRFVLFFLCITLGGFLGLSLKGTIFLNFDTVEMSYLDYYSRVGCGSKSMGLTLDCNDEIYGAMVRDDDFLDIGSIYVYQKGNRTIIHRLVECVDDNCNITIFKGDTNAIAEFVNREDILYKVVRVGYR